MYSYCPQQWVSDRLVEQNIKLVHKQASAIARKTREPYEDLLQEGVCGLLRAIKRFQPDKGYQFSTYATPFIYGRISQYLRDKGNTIKMPRTLYELAPREQRIRRELEVELGRSPTDREVADRMAVAEIYVKELKQAKRSTGIVSLDLPVANGDGQIALGEAIAASESRDTDLMQLLEKLEPGDRDLFWAVFVEERPKKHLARQLGKSTHWLNQRIQEGLVTLREAALV
jgi:RNA polymerase sigma-B factor